MSSGSTGDRAVAGPGGVVAAGQEQQVVAESVQPVEVVVEQLV
jgi:hypothetical protein